jgi:hypothetical protein
VKLIQRLFVTVLGLVFLLFGLAFYQGHAHKVSSWTRTTGVVIRHDVTDDSESTTYEAVASFTTPDGRQFEAREVTSSSNADYAVGQTVTVYYDPADPSSAIVDSAAATWLPLVFVGIGGLVLILGLFKPLILTLLIARTILQRAA